MVFNCIMCQKEKCYYYNLCSKCERVKDYISLYGDRVYEVLDNVLSRDEDKQNNKIDAEIVEEIIIKEQKLRQKKSQIFYCSPKTSPTTPTTDSHRGKYYEVLLELKYYQVLLELKNTKVNLSPLLCGRTQCNIEEPLNINGFILASCFSIVLFVSLYKHVCPFR